MAEFFTKSEMKANIDHASICSMSAYERNLVWSYLESRDIRILDEVSRTCTWLNFQFQVVAKKINAIE